MTSTFAARKKAATPAEATVHLCLDLQLHDRRREAYLALTRAKAAARVRSEDQVTVDAPVPTDTLAEHMRAADEIDAEVEAKSEPYVLRKLRKHEYLDLAEEHAPTDEEREQGGDVHGDTFWPAALAACSHEPKLTEDDVLWLRDGDDEWTGLPPTEFQRLVDAVKDLHSTGVVVPKDLLDTVRTLRSAWNGTTPAAKASPSRSSAAGSRKGPNRTG